MEEGEPDQGRVKGIDDFVVVGVSNEVGLSQIPCRGKGTTLIFVSEVEMKRFLSPSTSQTRACYNQFAMIREPRLENIADNPRLKQIYAEDQADRADLLWKKDNDLFLKRDKERLAYVEGLVKEDQLHTPADYLRAAMILQHGGEVRHYELAHKFAKLAAEAGYEPESGEPHPLWLAAAAKDRSLMYQEKPQLYGTQYRRDMKSGVWYLWPVDPSVTDEERVRNHVPALADAHKKAEELNERDKAQ